jgi:RHS repeat-associated protein
MLFGPEHFHSLAQAEVQYANLSTASWAQGNRDIHYSYDDNGSLTEKITAIKDEPDPQTYFEEKVTNTHNLQNRLAQIVRQYDDAGDTIEEFTEYTYNDNGIRVSKHTWSEINDTHQNDDVTVVYLVDSHNHTGYAQVLEEMTFNKADPDPLTETPDSLTTYVIGDDVIAQTKDGTTQYLLYDGHGSTRQLADSTGAIITDQNFSYDAYGVMLGGNPTSASPADTSLLYAGEQFDTDAQQYYLRARYYDPLNGRFNRVDPFSGSPSHKIV